jgi:hypothetical protein
MSVRESLPRQKATPRVTHAATNAAPSDSAKPGVKPASKQVTPITASIANPPTTAVRRSPKDTTEWFSFDAIFHPMQLNLIVNDITISLNSVLSCVLRLFIAF